MCVGALERAACDARAQHPHRPYYQHVVDVGDEVTRSTALQLHTGNVCLLPSVCGWSALASVRRVVKDSNVNGEGTILGGLLVVKQGQGGIAYMHAETSFGEFPPTEDVIAAATKAVGKA